MHNKKIFPLMVLFALPAICLPFVLTSCSNNKIVIANFESYMSDDVIDKLKHDKDIKSSLKFLYYATNEDIETKFKRYYDIAIPSSYEAISLLKNDQLAKIDWAQFSPIFQLDDSGTITTNIVTNGKEAETLFSATAKKMIDEENQFIDNLNLKDWIKGESSILDYAIPYFLQDWAFAYKHECIDGLSEIDSSDENYSKQIANTYKNILNVVAPNGSTNHNGFFDPDKTKKIGMIEDARTVFDFCKLIQTEDQSQRTINPEPNQSISDYENIYKLLTSRFNKQYFWLNSDSGQMNLALATPLKDGGLKAAFTYNGDILYAAMGSDLNPDGMSANDPKFVRYFDDNDSNHMQMNFIRPSFVPAMMDMMVINKDSANSDKKNDLYKIVRKICLDSANEETDNFENDISFQNWSYILYTNPLFIPDEYIKQDYFSEENENDFPNWHLLNRIYSMNDSDGSNLIENPISDMDKSNMYWAFVKEREKL